VRQVKPLAVDRRRIESVPDMIAELLLTRVVNDELRPSPRGDDSTLRGLDVENPSRAEPTRGLIPGSRIHDGVR
jgi:hypothetical protein